MKLESEKYLVTTDGKQFILQMKEVVKDSSMLEDKSKIGSIKLGSKSYYSTLPMLFNGMVKHSLLTDDEIRSFELGFFTSPSFKIEIEIKKYHVNEWCDWRGVPL